MKLQSIIALLAISATTALAQTEMGPHDKTWGIDKHRYSRGFLITRISGENLSYKTTNISYRSMDTVIYDRIKQAVITWRKTLRTNCSAESFDSMHLAVCSHLRLSDQAWNGAIIRTSPLLSRTHSMLALYTERP